MVHKENFITKVKLESKKTHILIKESCKYIRGSNTVTVFQKMD